MAKKRKVGEEVAMCITEPDSNEEEGTEEDVDEEEEVEEGEGEEDLTKLLEPFNKEQLIDLLRMAAANDHKILEEIHGIADRDPAHCKLFIHGLGWETTSEKLSEFFSQYGELEDCNVVVDNVTGKLKGYGFLLFKHRQGAQRALKEPQKKIESRMTTCQLASAGPINMSHSNPVPHTQQTQHPLHDNLPRKIYVGNVHSDIPADQLHAFFSKYREIEEGPLGFDKVMRKSKGFALGFHFLQKEEGGGRGRKKKEEEEENGSSSFYQRKGKMGLSCQKNNLTLPLNVGR